MTDETPTRLCFATPQFYPTYGGSHQRYMRYLPGFRAQGLAVRVFAGTATDEKVTRGDAAYPARGNRGSGVSECVRGQRQDTSG